MIECWQFKGGSSSPGIPSRHHLNKRNAFKIRTSWISSPQNCESNKVLLYVTAVCNWKGETGAEELCGISFEIFKPSNWVGSFGRILREWLSLIMSPGHFCELAQSANQNEELEATH